jgi:polysaccharide biosynthesis/export protein
MDMSFRPLSLALSSFSLPLTVLTGLPLLAATPPSGPPLLSPAPPLLSPAAPNRLPLNSPALNSPALNSPAVSAPAVNDFIPPEEDYTLAPGDKVKIEVLKLPQYNLETQVLVDGTISLLQVGRIDVRGMTLAAASQAASDKYAKLLRYPIVTIALINARPIRVGIAGEVFRRGSYDLSIGDGSNAGSAAVSLPTLTRALKTAGGITQAADIRQVQIRRPRYGQSDRLITLNLWEYVKGTNPRADIPLRDGDAIFVPAAEKLDLQESYQLAVTSFSAVQAQPLNIAVVGEVYRPGTHTVESTVQAPIAGSPGTARDTFNQVRIFPTLTRAIQTAGGVKPSADIRTITVRRVTQAGAEQTFDINLWDLLTSGDQKQDLILQDRDTIFVPLAKTINNADAAKVAAASFSPDKIRISIVGEVARPGILEVPPNTPLNKAILVAGGFTSQANRKNVDFIRVNPDSTVQNRAIPVNFALSIDERNNPALLNEDVIVVRRSGIGNVGDFLGNVFNPLNPVISVLNFFRLIR